MGQFLDYIATVFTGSGIVSQTKEKANNHTSFADNSFTNVFSKTSDSEKAAKIASLVQSNNRTIYVYQTIGAIAFLIQISAVTVPKIKLDTFDFLHPNGWQHITLSLVPLVIFMSSIGAMNAANKPLNDSIKSTKILELDFNEIEFIQSLKVIIVLVSICQVSTVFSEQLLWSIIMIVPIWCYMLTSRIVREENKRYEPSPKKHWMKLNSAKSPKSAPPVQTSIQTEAQVRATPRTRTRRAVKNIISGVTDKYHAFEQNVAHQLSQKVFTPLSPKLKMIET